MLSRITTRSKLFLLSGTLLLLMVLQIVFTLVELDLAGRKADELIVDRYPKIEQQTAIISNTLYVGMLLREAVLLNDAAAIEASLQKIGEYRADSTQRLKYLHEHAVSAESKALLEDIEVSRRVISAQYEAMFTLIRANQDVEATQYLQQRYDPAYRIFQQKVEAMVASQKGKMHTLSQETHDSFAQMRWLMVLFGLTALVLGLLAAAWLARSITGPLAQALAAAERIAAGDLSLSKLTKNHTGSDEPSRMLQALDAMQRNLHEMTQLIQHNARQVSGAAHGLATLAQQVATSAQNQSAATAGAAATLEQLTVSIHHVADNAEDAVAQARAAGVSAQHSGAQVATSSQQMNVVGLHIDESAKQMNSLEQDVSEIGKIAVIIRDVADQTNLLALNAAIEAARAGESGRGFAVVADEVRKLAERTNKSANEISVMITHIEQGSEAVSGLMGDSVSSVRLANESTSGAAAAMREIEGNANAVVVAVNQISHALNEQKLAGHDLAERMELVAQTAEENGHTVRSLASTAEQLSQLSEQLESAVQRFKID